MMTSKQYEELTFSDDFMFCKVLQNNPELCRELLELILGDKIGELVTVNKQYPVEVTHDRRGVRFDVYAKDDKSVIYDIEMQNAREDNLPKRARYSQGIIDTDLMDKGAKFCELPRSYVIFICKFNLLPEIGRHMYSFRNLCVEDPSLELNDECEKIFLCTTGDAEDISPDMKAFLEYVSGNSPEGDFVKKLEDAVRKERVNTAARKEYMDLQYYMDRARAEGRAEGRVEGRSEGEEKFGRLAVELIAAGRAEEITKAARDAELRKELYREYHISDD